MQYTSIIVLERQSMPKHPELSTRQREAIAAAVQRASELTEPGQNEMVQIDAINDSATRIAVLYALQKAL